MATLRIDSEIRIKTEFLLRAIFLLNSFLLASCVSVSIGPKSAEKSKGVIYTAPAGNFRANKETQADGAWQNRNNGNSISYLSTCNDPADPSLEIAARELFAEIKDLKILNTKTLTFNAREALEMEVEGRVDGVPTRIRALLFKKNDCLYTLSHVGLTKSFESDRTTFDRFLGGFQAP